MTSNSLDSMLLNPNRDTCMGGGHQSSREPCGNLSPSGSPKGIESAPGAYRAWAVNQVSLSAVVVLTGED
jgi:hypothetical protein